MGGLGNVPSTTTRGFVVVEAFVVGVAAWPFDVQDDAFENIVPFVFVVAVVVVVAANPA